MKLDYPRWAIIAGSALVIGGFVIATQQPDTLDTNLFQGVAWARILNPTASPFAQTVAESTAAATSAPQPDTHCLDCHSDVEALKKLAKETEPTESLSSGEG